MPKLFLTGPLSWPPLLGLVAGGDVPGGRPATLEGACIDGAGGPCFPPLLPRGDGCADGVVVEDIPPEMFDRLSFFAAALGQAPVPKHITLDGVRMAAVVFLGTGVPDPACPGWDMAHWSEHWGDVVLSAAAEIMGYHGREPGGDLHWRLPMILSRAEVRRQAAQAAPATVRSAMTADAVQDVQCRDSHAGFFLTRECHLHHPTFDGHQSPRVRREVFVASDAAIVLPYDPARDRVLLVEQFRMGPYGRGDPLPFVLEPVAGRVDAGETPEQCARRECAEEAGLTLRGLEHISSHYCSPGCSTEFYHCYTGMADLPYLGQGRGGVADEDEDIRTHVLPFEAAMGLMASGEANVGPLVLMLLWLERERPRLRSDA